MRENDNDGPDGWEASWVRVFEMPMGSKSQLPYAKQIVNAEMERIGNEVERPLVMQVRVRAVSGEINRDKLSEGTEEQKQ